MSMTPTEWLEEQERKRKKIPAPVRPAVSPPVLSPTEWLQRQEQRTPAVAPPSLGGRVADYLKRQAQYAVSLQPMPIHPSVAAEGYTAPRAPGAIVALNELGKELIGGYMAGGGALGAKVAEQATGEVLRRAAPIVRPVAQRIAQAVRRTPEPPAVAGPAAQTAEQRVIQALREAKPVRAKTEALYSAERSRRLGEAMAAGERVPGEAGFRQQLGALKGELPKAQFEPIREKIGQQGIDALYDQVRASPLLSGFDKITAQTGLDKLLGVYGGNVPTAGELKLLGRVFSPEFIRTTVAKRGLLPNIMDTAAQVIGVPRAIMASGDLSAPFRQGAVALPSFPKQFGQSFVKMFRLFGDERAFQGLKENIVRRPTFDLMERHGLALTGLDKGVLVGREEQFVSTLAERIPLFGRMVHASNRAYTGFLMKLRADAFDEMLRRAETAGVERSPAVLDSMAKFVNTATGRGDLGSLEIAGNALSTALFSPRLLASRLNLLNPLWYTTLDPFVRKQALKGSLGFVALGTTVLGLARAGGAQVGDNPLSADFGKIRVGNTRWSVFAGMEQYPRIIAQLQAGKLVSSTTGKIYTLGEGYRPMTRKDIALRVLESKANPAVGFALDLLEGRDFAGQPLHIPTRVRELFTPMVLQDLADIYKDDPSLLPWAVPAFFGVGIQTYGPKKVKR